MEKMRKYKPLPLLPVAAEASVLAADRSVDEDKPIAIDDARVLVDDERWVVGFHEVGLKLLEEFHFDKLFPKARGGLKQPLSPQKANSCSAQLKLVVNNISVLSVCVGGKVKNITIRWCMST